MQSRSTETHRKRATKLIDGASWFIVLLVLVPLGGMLRLYCGSTSVKPPWPLGGLLRLCCAVLSCALTRGRGPARVWRVNPDTSKRTDDIGQETGRSRASVVFPVPGPRVGVTGLGFGVGSWQGLSQDPAL